MKCAPSPSYKGIGSAEFQSFLEMETIFSKSETITVSQVRRYAIKADGMSRPAGSVFTPKRH
jgi:hypothetical protein